MVRIYTYSFMDYLETEFKDDPDNDLSLYFNSEVRMEFEWHIENSINESIKIENREGMELNSADLKVSITDKDVFYHSITKYEKAVREFPRLL